MKIKDAELKSILAEVEGEIASLIKSEKAKLAKNASEQSPGGESSPVESSPAGDSASAAPEGSESAGAPAMSAAPAPSAAPAAAPGAPEAAPADPAAAGMDAGAPPSLEELSAEYSKLPPEELKMHYLAAKTALFQTMGSADAGAGMDPAAGAAPSPAPASPSASPAGDVPPAPPAMKGEMPYGSKTVGNDESASDSNPKPTGTGDTKDVVTKPVSKGSMPYGSKKEGDDSKASDSNPKPTGTGQTKPVITEKSELESELESLRKGQSEITKVLEALIGTPERKAFTGTEIQYIKKSEIESKPAPKKLRKSLEEMTTVDVNARLNEITRSPSLKKSDRERINQFYANMLDLNEIKDLLTDEV